MPKTSWTPQSTPTFWINLASRMIMRQFEDELRPLGFGFAYIPVLCALEENGPLIQKDLVAQARVEQPTMTALLTRMERDGVIQRSADSADGRAKRISLTAESKKKLPLAKTVLQAAAEKAMAGMKPHEREALIHLLQRVVHNLGEHN